jgi:hypothetical protein
MNGHPHGDRVRSLRVAHFRAQRPSWPRPEQQGAGALSLPPFERIGKEHPYPFRSRMAKVELYTLR